MDNWYLKIIAQIKVIDYLRTLSNLSRGSSTRLMNIDSKDCERTAFIV